MANNASAVKMAPNCTTTELLAGNEFKELNNADLQVDEQTKDLYADIEGVEDDSIYENEEEECFHFQSLETKLKRKGNNSQYHILICVCVLCIKNVILELKELIPNLLL